jgi:hypothetical protein
LKKSEFTAFQNMGRMQIVTYGDFIDEALRLFENDSADGVRWEKGARIRRKW